MARAIARARGRGRKVSVGLAAFRARTKLGLNVTLRSVNRALRDAAMVALRVARARQRGQEIRLGDAVSQARMEGRAVSLPQVSRLVAHLAPRATAFNVTVCPSQITAGFPYTSVVQFKLWGDYVDGNDFRVYVTVSQGVNVVYANYRDSSFATLQSCILEPLNGRYSCKNASNWYYFSMTPSIDIGLTVPENTQATTVSVTAQLYSSSVLLFSSTCTASVVQSADLTYNRPFFQTGNFISTVEAGVFGLIPFTFYHGGYSTAKNIVHSVTLPAKFNLVDYLMVGSSGCSFSNSTVTCTLPQLVWYVQCMFLGCPVANSTTSVSFIIPSNTTPGLYNYPQFLCIHIRS